MRKKKSLMPGIYKITCIENGKVYIGQSRNVIERIKDHKRRLANNTHDNKHLQNSWNKYSATKFKFEIIETCGASFEELNEREIYWMNVFDSLNKDVGFNIASGGGNGYSLQGMTEEEKAEVYKKISATRSGKYSGENHPNYGKPMSEEQKDKISKSLSGEGSFFYGKKRKEHSEKMKGSKNPRSRKVICLNTQEVFECAKYAGEKYETTNSNILKCCRGVQSHAGTMQNGTRLMWEYAN